MSGDRTSTGDPDPLAFDDEPATEAPDSDDMTIAFTPKQLFTGFAIVAGLILLATRRGRRSSKQGGATSTAPGAERDPGTGRQGD